MNCYFYFNSDFYYYCRVLQPLGQPFIAICDCDSCRK